MMIKIKYVGIIFACSLFLPGCMDMAMSGAQCVYNRRSIQKNVGEHYTTMQAYKAIKKDKTLSKNANVVIATFNDEVLLVGQVPEAWQRRKAEQIVKSVSGDSEIHNLITISSPSSSLTRISDAWITTKVKSKLIACDDLDAAQIKVVTENGTVFLMGTLPPSEADAAVELASNTDGVNKVVKVFKYVHISKK